MTDDLLERFNRYRGATDVERAAWSRGFLFGCAYGVVSAILIVGLGILAQVLR